VKLKYKLYFLYWISFLLVINIYGNKKALWVSRVVGGSATTVAVVEEPPVEGGEDAISETNRIDWASLTGVEAGNIPYRTTISSTLSPGTTVAAINTAINTASATSNRVVAFDAGTYTLSGNIIMKSGVTLRGAGTNTVFVLDGYIAMGEAGYSRQNVNINSGFTKGSSTVTLASAPPDLTIGSIMMITESNNTTYVHQHGYEVPNPDNWVLDGVLTLTYKATSFLDTFDEMLVNGVLLTERASAALVNANAGSYFLDEGATTLWVRLPDDTNPEAAANKLGYRLLCSYCDEPETPQGARVRGQMVKVTGISGNDVSFTPALLSPFDKGARVSYPAALSTFNVETELGIENMTIHTPTAATAVWVSGARSWWLSNVVFQIRGEALVAVKTYFCYRGNIQRCGFVGQVNSSADAILSQIHSWGTRVEDCYFARCSQVFTQVGRGGANVFAYNYVHSLTNGASTAMISDITGHGAHPQWTLIEGNKFFKLHADSIHGSASSWTVFRNWIRGEETNRTTFGYGCVNIDSWNYHMNIVGNILGHTNMSGWNLLEDAVEDDSDTDKSIFAFNYSGYNESYTYDGTNSLKTAIIHGNYDYATGLTNYSASISTRTYTNSYYLSAKPSWFGTNVWPTIGPDIAAKWLHRLPAEDRLLLDNP
jgi:hypothetical protein